MFGFGKRKKYNGIVDDKLKNEYQISTNDAPGFPGVLAYLDLIDNAWNAEMTENEAALYIATLYYCGLIKHGHLDSASALMSRIESIVQFCIPKGSISQARWDKFSASIEQKRNEFGIDKKSDTAPTALENDTRPASFESVIPTKFPETSEPVYKLGDVPQIYKEGVFWKVNGPPSENTDFNYQENNEKKLIPDITWKCGNCGAENKTEHQFAVTCNFCHRTTLGV